MSGWKKLIHATLKHACKPATTKCLSNLGQAMLDVHRLVHVEAFRNSEHISTLWLFLFKGGEGLEVF
jgi:hypothetical protein